MQQEISVDGRTEKRLNYGFYGRLKAEFPSQLIVDVTEKCNLACNHCPHSDFKKSSYYSGAMLEPILNEKLVDEVRNYGKDITKYVRYCAEGEPLIHKHIYEMLRYAVLNSGVIVTMTTNGTLMNERNIKRLLDTGIHVIDISIDAFKEETYAKIRVNGDLKITRYNVLKLIEMSQKSQSHPKVVVSYVEQDLNRLETDDFESFWKLNGAEYVVVRRLHSASGAVKTMAEKLRKENLKEVRRPCLYPWERIVLNPRGYLAFCPADWTHGSTIVDYRGTSIHATWHGEFYEKLRTAHLTNDFTEYKFCRQCPDWRSTRWPDEDRSYADMIEDFNKSE